jgi:septal ring factor EnvC (AmiA/AmiB activator)
MKTIPQIEEEIQARQAELQSLVSAHQNMVAQFQQQFAKNQQRANFLEGHIEALKGLLPKPKREKKGKQHAAS